MQNNTKSHPMPRLKRLAHQLGLIRGYQRMRQLRSLTLKGALHMQMARRKYLRRVLQAQPVAADDGNIEVHMLLNQPRIFEGLWALYSFVHFAGQACRIVIHDDGSLGSREMADLHQVFPGCQIISRQTADSVVLGHFQDKSLERCAHLRKTLIFALKLFDPFFFSNSPRFVLLDSDVLFYSRPSELLAGLEETRENLSLPNLYSVDNGYRYCLDREELEVLLGQPCIEQFNPGLIRVNRDVLVLDRIERYLEHPSFWNEDGTGNYYTELTL